MKKVYFSIALYIQKNHPSSQAYNCVEKYIYLCLLFLLSFSFPIKHTKFV